MVLGRKTRRWFGRPTRPAEPPGGGPAGRKWPAETAAEDFGRKFGGYHRPVVRPAKPLGGGPAGRTAGSFRYPPPPYVTL